MGQILTQVPVSMRRPGVFSEFEFDQNPNSLVAIAKIIVVVAEAKGGTAPIEQPIEIFSGVDADAKLGQGTPAALGCKAAFATGNLLGSTPRVFACPMAESTGVQATETITITVPGSPASAGTLSVMIAGVVVNAGVNAGDSPTTIAASLAAAISAQAPSLPVTATAAIGVVTCPNVTKGTNGNDVTYTLLSAPAGVTVALAQSVAGTIVVNPTNALNALYDQRYHGIAFSNHATADIAIALIDQGTSWGFAQANYKFYFFASPASLGTAQALATAANNLAMIVPVCTGIPNLPVAIAAATATAWFSFNAPNQNMDGVQLALMPPTGANAFTDAEVETALAGGLTPLTPSGSFVKIERLVSTVTTFAGAPFEPTREPANTRTSAELSEQIAFAVATGVAQQNMSAEVIADIRDIIIRVDRIFETNGWIENVDDFLGQITAIQASAPSGRINAINPHTPVPPLHQVVNHNTMIQG